jgi:phosphomannomutase
MKPIRTLKISISGVRGVIGDSLSPTLLANFAQSFGTYVGGATVIVGRDTRTSGEMVRHAVVSGLIATGCQVIDVGVCPVPTVQLAVRNLHAQGGIAITASHNPADWNALKFIKSDGFFLSSYEAEELLRIYHQHEYSFAPSRRLRAFRHYPRAIQDHVDRILEKIGRLRKRFRVAVDCCNGAGSLMSPQFLEVLGCEVTAINTVPDGKFPRPPEPIPQHLSQLCDVVRRSKADIGFAQDADADRLAIISEKGEPVGEDSTLALATYYVLGKKPGTVVVNLSTSQVIDDIVTMRGGKLLRSRIGEVNVTDRMNAAGAIVGGEGNGGVIYPEVNFARDSFVAMALVLHLMEQERKPLSEILAQLPHYAMIKTSRQVVSDQVPALLEKLKSHYRGKKMDLQDGVKVYVDSAWIHIRPSNTEPIMRVVVEAPTQAQAEKLVHEVEAQLA